MKRVKPARRARRSLRHTMRVLAPRLHPERMDGRVALAVLWALGRLAQRLGPAA
jgi:hypothetical protein